MKRKLASLLRRWARQLHPLPQGQTYNIYATDLDAALRELKRRGDGGLSGRP